MDRNRNVRNSWQVHVFGADRESALGRRLPLANPMHKRLLAACSGFGHTLSFGSWGSLSEVCRKGHRTARLVSRLIQDDLCSPTGLAYSAASKARVDMKDAATVISKATGCTLSKAKNAVSELIARGWIPPDADRLPVGRDELAVPTTALPGLSAVNADETLVAHTDGACKGNPGPGGWAVVFSQGDKAIAEFSGSDPKTTNNRMELTAVVVVQICGMRTCVSGALHYPQASNIACQIVGAAPP